jgi:hypothetical protein
VSGGLALTVTSPFARSADSATLSANDGTCVSKSVTCCEVPAVFTGLRNVPCIAPVSVEAISRTLPALTWSRNNGAYAIVARWGPWYSAPATSQLTSSRAPATST